MRWTSRGWEPDALTAHVRIYEGATSIVHGDNIVTPPRETRWQTGKTNRILNTKELPYSPTTASTLYNEPPSAFAVEVNANVICYDAFCGTPIPFHFPESLPRTNIFGTILS